MRKDRKKWQDSYYTPKSFRSKNTPIATSPNGDLPWKTIVIFIALMAAATFIANKLLEKNKITPFPASGYSVWHTNTKNMNFAYFKINTPQNIETNYEVTLSQWHSGEPVVSIYIRGGESTKTEIPLGRYKIKVKTGKTWLGFEKKFGAFAESTEGLNPIEFYKIGNTTFGHSINLEKIGNGNMQMINSN